MSETKTEGTRGLRKTREGVVIRSNADKTIVVRVERRARHALYSKVIKRLKKFHVHDEENAAKIGDRVCIVESRPMSKMKRWRLQEILESVS